MVEGGAVHARTLPCVFVELDLAGLAVGRGNEHVEAEFEHVAAYAFGFGVLGDDKEVVQALVGTLEQLEVDIRVLGASDVVSLWKVELVAQHEGLGLVALDDHGEKQLKNQGDILVG